MIEVWHNPHHDDAYEAGCAARMPDFEHCKRVARVDTDDPDVAFSLTNHIEQDWRMNEGVATTVQGPVRSTSMGDLMVTYDAMGIPTVIVCAPCGWQGLDAFAMDLAKRHRPLATD